MNAAARRRRAAATALVAIGLASCGGGARRLRPGERPSGPPVGLAEVATEGGPGLGYAVWLGGDRLVSVELGVEFELAVRRLAPDGALGARRALRLGPPDWDAGALAVNRGGRRAYVAVADGTVREVALDDGAPRELRRFMVGERATAIALAAGDRLLAIGTAAGVVCLRRLPDGALLQCLVAHRGALRGLDARGDLLATAASDGEAAVFRLPALRPLRRLRRPGPIDAVALAPDRRTLAIAVARAAGPETGAELIPLGDPAMRPRARIAGHPGGIAALAWTADGGGLVTAGRDRTVRMWDSADGRARARRDGFGGRIRGLAIGADGRVAVAAWARDGHAPMLGVYDVLFAPGGPAAAVAREPRDSR